MKSAVFVKPGQMMVKEVAQPKIQEVDDVVIKVIRACVCGSDLWKYRGLDAKETNSDNTGHEALGVVTATGQNISTVQPGDFVIVPFTDGCGHCAACLAGFDGSCSVNKGRLHTGTQAEYVLMKHCEWSLIKIPGKPADYSDGMLNSLLTLADVMATGYHAARVAEVQRGDSVVVVGDGAVGLCGVLAAKIRGAKQIIALSRHEDRQKLALEFGATDIVAERGEEAVQKVMSLTHNAGMDAVLECVGTDLAVQTALQVGRPGAIVGRVGLPHEPQTDLSQYFYKNIRIAGGPASVTTYDKQFLLQAVLDGNIRPGKVFTKQFNLDQIDQAYQAMDQRQAIKSLVVID
ncbi:zinc-binding dehydrogenase [Bombilactobacillus folatiphilus]|uniref:Zinc-binding dehydrogenase n=1 Tax=Bombilactobacillus folatiphilus TaxID=2923362 RepID=A0ABY4PAB9_9LACO|nr:zinc-binding dehydrogenase [Bombilactobacillus folatiphilus]UQS82570.1 zinc-binding dehydrogenase [Bombilactobacillus folatiphilus]